VIEMNVWFRSAALAGGALLLMGIHVGAQIREGGSSVIHAPKGSGPIERPNHPVVLWNNRDNVFVGGERIVAQLRVQLDPETVSKVHPPAGVDGIIAYPGSRMLMVRGTREGVASYRASLAKLEGEAAEAPSDTREPAKTKEKGKAVAVVEASATRPVITMTSNAKIGLHADRIDKKGGVVQASGHVIIELANGVELHAQQIRVTTKGGEKQIVIEK
jgi:hypothetical protein